MGTEGTAVGWAASGAVGPNAAYRNQTLQYGDVELAFDESVDFRTIKRLWFTAAVSATLVFAVVGALPALFAEDVDALRLGVLISFVVFWLTLLASGQTEPISEWKTLLEEKAAASSSAYAAIYGALSRRRIPVSAVPARIRSDITPEVVHNRLVIRSGRYVAYVTVFAYGTSLYVGWTMWRSRSGAVVIGHFLKDLVGSFMNRTGSVNQMLRTDRPRAMREAVHSAAREGVEIAIQGIEVPLASTFGQEVPIQDAPSAPTAPVPPTPPSPPAPAPSPGRMPGMPPVSPSVPPMTPPPQAPYTSGWNGS
ncbi:adhesin [Streptomyces alanosinicus]|nr:adhesin [Streptomyces alanosinicus]